MAILGEERPIMGLTGYSNKYEYINDHHSYFAQVKQWSFIKHSKRRTQNAIWLSFCIFWDFWANEQMKIHPWAKETEAYIQ